MTYLILAFAIIAEVVATTLLKYSVGFTKFTYGIGSLVAYGVCFYLLSQVMNVLPVGIVYAMWSGLGIVLISLVSFLLLGQKLDLPALLGMAMILVGVVVMNLFSKSMFH